MIRTVNVFTVIANQFFPVTNVEVSLGSNGSLSTVNGTSSIAMLRSRGIDIYKENQAEEGASIDVYAGYDGNATRIFSGVLDEFELDMDNDVITFQGRDHAANMADTKEVPSGLDYKNQTIGQIVKQIAEKFELTPKVTDPGTKAGTEQYGKAAYMPHAQQYWSMLQDLAAQCGYECYVTPEKELFFGPLEKSAGGATADYTYAPGPQDSDTPIRGLKFKYQPRRNGNVDVEVVSYHPTQNKHVRGKATAKAKSANSSKAKGKFVVGKPTKGVQSAKSGGTKPSAKPKVVRRMDGLTKEQADAKAEAIAKDIAKRQVIVSGQVEGDETIKIHSKLKVKPGQLSVMGFDALSYFVTSVSHKFDMPSGGEGGGYMTSITAMTEPEVS